METNLTNTQNDYSVFLPSISGFYATFVGKQRYGEYVDPARIPAGLGTVESLNFLNPADGAFSYRWALYSAGHAELDVNKFSEKEDMLRNRNRDTSWLLGDSGGFQIAKGLWEGEWKDPNGAAVKAKMQDCIARKTEERTIEQKDKNGKIKTKTITVDLVKEYQARLDAAQKKRELVINWMEAYMDYGMMLDIPTWTFQDKKASAASGIASYQDAVEATHTNARFYMANRRGNFKVLNVLQGSNHDDADSWYNEFKDYCDPAKYPETHFDGWAMGGQNMCDVHLILRRLVHMIHDGLLETGIHDVMHFLGTSKLEWAVLLTDIQRAVRKYHNPNFMITYDCASPFLATANGQVYHTIRIEDRGKWSYMMSPSADDKAYAADTRLFSQAVVQDGILDSFEDSPISRHCNINDICIYKPGDLNKVGNEGRTSWDSFSYALQMGHNVWMHIESTQRANREYDAGKFPYMLIDEKFERTLFKDVVDEIFKQQDRNKSLAIIEQYNKFWMQVIGTRLNVGKKTVNSITQYGNNFDERDAQITAGTMIEQHELDLWSKEKKEKPSVSDEQFNNLFDLGD